MDHYLLKRVSNDNRTKKLVHAIQSLKESIMDTKNELEDVYGEIKNNKEDISHLNDKYNALDQDVDELEDNILLKDPVPTKKQDRFFICILSICFIVYIILNSMRSL
jgi:predicted  nucleic acid-binding Zn-ribbon protein